MPEFFAVLVVVRKSVCPSLFCLKEIPNHFVPMFMKKLTQHEIEQPSIATTSIQNATIKLTVLYRPLVEERLALIANK